MPRKNEIDWIKGLKVILEDCPIETWTSVEGLFRSALATQRTDLLNAVDKGMKKQVYAYDENEDSGALDWKDALEVLNKLRGK